MSFVGDSYGKLSKTGLGDLLFTRPGSSERIMPRQVVLSSKCFITFRFSGDTEQVEVAQFDQFNKVQRIGEKKNFKPYGFVRNVSLINHSGWELSFTGKKTDFKLSYIIDQQELLLAGITDSGLIDTDAAANGAKLTFDITELITYLPNDKGEPTLKEAYVYRDCSILSYSEDTPSDNQPITFNITFFCPRREISGESTVAGIFNNLVSDNITPAVEGLPFEKQITNMIIDTLRRNKQ